MAPPGAATGKGDIRRVCGEEKCKGDINKVSGSATYKGDISRVIGEDKCQGDITQVCGAVTGKGDISRVRCKPQERGASVVSLEQLYKNPWRHIL